MYNTMGGGVKMRTHFLHQNELSSANLENGAEKITSARR